MLKLCIDEIKEIIFIGISQEDMVAVRESLKGRFGTAKTVPGTRTSHHFIPLTRSKIIHKLTSEDIKFIPSTLINILLRI